MMTLTVAGDDGNAGEDDYTGYFFVTGAPPKSLKYRQVNLG